jgi:hypothetical protein
VVHPEEGLLLGIVSVPYSYVIHFIFSGIHDDSKVTVKRMV